jgi:hypothetical protein
MTHPDATYRSVSIRDLAPWSSPACAGWSRDCRDRRGNAIERANHQLIGRLAWASHADRMHAIARDRATGRQQRPVGVPSSSGGLYEWSFTLG